MDLEQNRLKESVGCQDQIASAYGGMNVIKFERDDSFSVTPLGLSDDPARRFREMADALLHGQQPDLVGVRQEADQQSRRQCRAHACACARWSRWPSICSTPARLTEFGQLLHESWTLKRRLTDGTSTTTIDRIYDDARRAGALGGKLLGAGGTGFMVFVVPPDHQAGRACGAVTSHHGSDFRRLSRARRSSTARKKNYSARAVRAT